MNDRPTRQMPVNDSDHKPTEQEALMQALAASEAKHRAILNTVLDGIVTINHRGIIESINPAGEKLFGYDKTELLGKNVSMLMPEPYSSGHDRYLSNYLESGTAKIIGIGRELYGLRKDKTVFPLSLAVSEVVIDGQQVFTGILRDISAQHRNRAEIEQARAELELRVIERTKELEDSVLEKEVLLKEIHHRVKNNLQLISSLLNLRLRRSEGMTSEELVCEIRDRIQTIAVVHEMLYQAEDLGQINFGDYLKVLTSNLMQYYASNNIALSFTAEPLKLNLEQSTHLALLTNELVTNSLKYAFPSNQAGTLAITLTKSGKNLIALTIADNGIGIPEKITFENIETLGLELVKKLAAKLQATLDLDRRNGTTFHLEFTAKGV